MIKNQIPLWQQSDSSFLDLKNLWPNQNGDFVLSINVFVCFKQGSFAKFKGFDSKLLTNLQWVFHSRALGSPWELSFGNTSAWFWCIVLKPGYVFLEVNDRRTTDDDRQYVIRIGHLKFRWPKNIFKKYLFYRNINVWTIN